MCLLHVPFVLLAKRHGEGNMHNLISVHNLFVEVD